MVCSGSFRLPFDFPFGRFPRARSTLADCSSLNLLHGGNSDGFAFTAGFDLIARGTRRTGRASVGTLPLPARLGLHGGGLS